MSCAHIIEGIFTVFEKFPRASAVTVATFFLIASSVARRALPGEHQSTSFFKLTSHAFTCIWVHETFPNFFYLPINTECHCSHSEKKVLQTMCIHSYLETCLMWTNDFVEHM